MLEKLKQKLQSRAGESIGETLVSLLIAALALVMLAGAISSSSGVIVKSRTKLNDYYSANEETSGVVKMETDGSSVTKGITIKDSSSSISEQSFNVDYFKNDKFGKKTVIAYELSD